MSSLDGFSMHALTRELDRTLSGGRIDKITQPNKQTIILSVRQPGRNFLLHITTNPANPAAHLLLKPLENPPEPPVFCMVLRKQIETGRIAAIRQHGLDRLLLIDIDTIGAGGVLTTKTLVLELMGKYSNIILTADGKIIDAIRKIGNANSRVRTVLPGDDYELPPAQDKLDLFTAPMADILARVKSFPELKLQKALLQACLGFGPVSAREACKRAGLPANMFTVDLGTAECDALAHALMELREAVDTDTPTPVIVTDANKKILAMAAFPLHYLTEGTTTTYEDLSAMLDAADKLAGSYVLPDKDRFQKLVKNEKNRATGKLAKLDDELAAAENADEWKRYGDNLMTYQYELTDHADAEVTVPDIYSESGETITIPLDQRTTIIGNMQACYKRYDKLKRAQSLLVEQKNACAAEIAYLETIEASLLVSKNLADINEIHNELIAGGYLREKPKKKNNDKPARPFCFTAPDGTTILVGKNNFQNDKLTTKTAAYNDTWFHTKSIPGSHVIVRNGGAELAKDTLELAAMLAAHFSKAQDGSNTPVDYTQIRYVKKPSGAKPGFVIFTNQTTVYVTPDEEKLAPVLAADKNA